MKNICLIFHVHHPFHFQQFRFFDVGISKSYYDDSRIEGQIHDAAANYYLPVNDLLHKLIKKLKGKLKLSFYISGPALDQFIMYAPKIITSFKQLADTGLVEFMGGTSSHSIVSLSDNTNEFKRQIVQNKERLESLIGQTPLVFVNTDLLFSNQIAKIVSEAGYSTIFTNGAKKILQWRSPNYLYSGENRNIIKILFRNEAISNTFSKFNFLENKEQFKQLFESLQNINESEPFVNIYFDYRNLGGIKRIDRQQIFISFVKKIICDEFFSFSLLSDLAIQFDPIAEVGTDEPICWAEHFHSSYFPGNNLQKDAIQQLFKLSPHVVNIQNPGLQKDWQYLQISDHFHLMDENHPDYLDNSTNPGIYLSKYDAYINYTNILEDFRQRIKAEKTRQKIKHTVLHEPIHEPPVINVSHQYNSIYK